MSLSLPPPPNGQAISEGDDAQGKRISLKVNHFWGDWFFRLQTLLNSLIPAGGAQAKIQFQDEGVNLGTSGTVTTMNLTGPNLITTRSVDTLTVTERASSRAYAARH